MLVSHSTLYVLCELLVIFVNVRFCQDLRTMHALWQSGSLYEKSKSIDILISFFFFQEYIFVLKMFLPGKGDRKVTGPADDSLQSILTGRPLDQVRYG